MSESLDLVGFLGVLCQNEGMVKLVFGISVTVTLDKVTLH